MTGKEDALTIESIARSRVLYKSSKRGMKELDLIFERFNKNALPQLSYSELLLYEEVLDMQDNDVFQAISTGVCSVDNHVLTRLVEFVKGFYGIFVAK